MSRRNRDGDVPFDAPEARPTVVSLDWDHGSELLVDRSPGVSARYVDPAELGLDASLIARMSDGADRVNALTPHLIGERQTPEDDLEHAALDHELLTLAHELQHRLSPDVEVLVHGRTLRDHRRR